MGYSRRATERRDCYQGWQRGSGPWWGVAKNDRAVASPEGAGGVPSVPACPATMWPCLLLALALMGTVSASHPGGARPCPCHGSTAGRCPWAQVSARSQPVPVPQRYCQDVYRGQLVSVHSAARNQELQKLAKTYHTIISPWIGAVTSRRAGQCESYWEDSSPWNYANWAPTHPYGIVTTCTTLSIRDGLWRSRFCFQLRPFICQY
ncbi:uncharacterized protein LOC110485057 [Lonchura striata]